MMTLPSVVENGVDIASRRSMHRRFSDDYKRKIVAEYESFAEGSPERGSLFRREGLRRTQVFEWRKTHGVNTPKPRRTKRDPAQVEIDRLAAKNAKLELELQRTRLALEITGKAHALLESFSQSADSETGSSK